ncbi:MAG: triacylglycerol lipase [Clostridia bacterium]|nr:triacylglycerol lipase [Clostridia bacterium]
MKKCRVGVFLLSAYILLTIFLISNIVFFFVQGNLIIHLSWKQWIFLFIFRILSLLIGMVIVYFNSKQLTILYKLSGILLGFIPILNIKILIRIIKIVYKEAIFELDKIKLNQSRAHLKICQTKYPILLVHGVFFRDVHYYDYWGRIDDQLKINGANIYYGNQNSASSVKENGRQLSERIKQICKDTGCEKVNIIAHSKGGLDARAAISFWDCEDNVATCTTISTPHRGCEFADYLLEKIPDDIEKGIAATYNATMKALGDTNPSFLDAVYDITFENCEKFNEEALDSEKVVYYSVGTEMKGPSGGTFPLNFTSKIISRFDGPNDGLVGEKSFQWGDYYECIVPKGHRGISHGDIIDLTGENIDGFDVREYYVQLVARLKNNGY